MSLWVVCQQSKQKAGRRKKWQSKIEDLAEGGDVRWSKQCFLGGSVMTEEGLSFVCVFSGIRGTAGTEVWEFC